ncbi:MAG: phosphatidylserine decarboxylase family protein [Syntrophales bacterium]|nr:phosphatidylserine decarboxylase family protein [Syntrophales bacterium]
MNKYKIPVAKEGWPFFFVLVIFTLLMFVFGWKVIGLISCIFTLFVLSFFRDPERTVPEGQNVVVSPADGKVVVIKNIYEPDYLREEVTQVSIFLSVFNVHVNRAPLGGVIETVKYNPGSFHLASVDKASLDNEQIGMVIRGGNRKILVKQIAGFIARRVICYAKPGDVIKKGDRYGLIRFGSRADIFLPKDAEIKVQLGDRVKGARDIIGLLKEE